MHYVSPCQRLILGALTVPGLPFPVRADVGVVGASGGPSHRATMRHARTLIRSAPHPTEPSYQGMPSRRYDRRSLFGGGNHELLDGTLVSVDLVEFNRDHRSPELSRTRVAGELTDLPLTGDHPEDLHGGLSPNS